MPLKPWKPCAVPGCPELVKGTYCEAHAKQKAAQVSARRNKAWQHLYDSPRWRRERKVHLAAHPLCVECEKQGRAVPATTVDHIKPHKGNEQLFWDRSNWQSMCSSCHSRKTIDEGRFGER